VFGLAKQFEAIHLLPVIPGCFCRTNTHYLCLFFMIRSNANLEYSSGYLPRIENF